MHNKILEREKEKHYMKKYFDFLNIYQIIQCNNYKSKIDS